MAYSNDLDVQGFCIGGEKLFLRLAEAESGNSSGLSNLPDKKPWKKC